MPINETVTGDDSVAITGTATAGQRTVGVKGIGDSIGLHGEGNAWNGVEGISHSTSGGFGVFGTNTAGGTGVAGTSTAWVGVYGETAGITNGPAGVWGEHKGAGIGVKAVSNTGIGLVAFSNSMAASLQGNVEITGALKVQGTDLISNIKAINEAIQQLQNQINALELQINLPHAS
jgi:hypothetical protein